MAEHPWWSIFGCCCTMCMCLHNCQTDCLVSNLAKWQRYDWNLQQEEKKRSVLFQQTICGIWAASKTKWSPKRKHETAQTAQLAKLTSSVICSLSPQCVRTAACLLPLRRLEAPHRGRGSSLLIFISTLTDRAWRKRQATALVPTWWPDEGFRVQHPLVALHMQVQQDRHDAGPCL